VAVLILGNFSQLYATLLNINSSMNVLFGVQTGKPKLAILAFTVAIQSSCYRKLGVEITN
jgi:hypothetical protein